MNAERLLQLAKHLETGKRGNREFDFSHYSLGGYTPGKDGSCGSSGCALGECPAIWPDEWDFFSDNNLSSYFVPAIDRFRSSVFGNVAALYSAEVFFGISLDEASALFVPGQEIRKDDFYLPSVNFPATRHEVAARIRAFVRWKEEQ